MTFLTFSYSQQKIVQPFIPEILSQLSNVRDIAISPFGDEMFITLQSTQSEISAILFLKKNNGQWSSPTVASFSGQYQDLEPFFSPNGLRLYFASNRPLSEKIDTTKDFDIWYIERKEQTADWSSPINIGSPINTQYNEFYPSVSKNNTMYFTSDNPTITKGKDDILFSQWKDSMYTKPVSLGDSINSAGYEFNAYVSPDETFMIYTCYNRPDGYGSGDLYMSVKKNNTWSKAKNIGKTINSPQMDYCPFVDIQTKTLYFTSKRNTITQKFSSPQTLKQLLSEINKYENGFSRIYTVPLKNIID